LSVRGLNISHRAKMEVETKAWSDWGLGPGLLLSDVELGFCEGINLFKLSYG